MNYWGMICSGLLGMAVIFLLVPLIINACRSWGWLQRQADFHHTHQGPPVPRLGGLALAVAFIAVEIFITLVYPDRRANIQGRSVIVFCSLGMFAVGFWDDLRPIGARRKLLL